MMLESIHSTMKYKLFKLHFDSRLHAGIAGLQSASKIIHVETLFSALFIEALKQSKEAELLKQVSEEQLKFSSCFPFVGNELFLPKPIMLIVNENVSLDRKFLKNIAYIPLSRLNSFINKDELFEGDYPTPNTKNNVSEMVSLENDGSMPYYIASTQFDGDSGLYFIVQSKVESSFDLIEGILSSLQYSGIGGKRNIGFGQFSYQGEDVPEAFKELLSLEDKSVYMNLGSYYPSDLNVLSDATYLITQKGGYTDYSNGAISRKKRGFVLQEGSCFNELSEGVIENVSFYESQTVYRYLNPVFIGVKL